ncbi:hypothetical protein [Winogradskyella sp.]|uniref:hypothetical protein n=1 Tax=Winogradskyella sp. TaxID=1883156 RepID=UPI0025D2F775|nr:hypothetical protein [Winogradskyella sp.]
MKKLVLILLTLSLFTACENEPLDPDFVEQGGGDDGGDDGSESGDLSLSLYELDTDLTFSFFGLPLRTITNSDINVSNDKIVSSIVSVSVENSPFETENQSYTRNGSGQITNNISVNSEGVTTNEYIISYSAGVVSQITYDYFEDDVDDYTYNFTYDGNTITRTEVGSSISTVFTLDGFDRVIRKESFDDTFSIQNEAITYNGAGNINNSVATGETEHDFTYNFDENTNPLQMVYNDNYLVNFLSDDYSDEIGPLIAQFHSTNNWNGAVFNGDSFTFDLTYNTIDRIISRDIIYDFGEALMVEINERFNYVN